MRGKVYLVGAGPGDPGLFTLKGRAVLERADCVIFDVLVNKSLLRFTRPECERICVNQLGPRPVIRQAQINRLLVSKAREGRVVARLKGGDPFIFGRGGEEAEELARERIPFEVVPGISAGYAACAYAGIPVTHRDFVSGVAFITGHEVQNAGGKDHEVSSPPLRQETLVFFMGSKNLSFIAESLIRRGRAPETPVAVIRWGTLPAQEVTVGTLADIAARAGKVQPPSIIVVGEVVKLREQLNWFEQLPLWGKRIIITRPRDQAAPLREALEELGAQVIEIPSIEIRPPDSWEQLDGAVRRLEKFHYLLLTSANGVRIFLERLQACGRDVRDLKGLVIGAIGPATAKEFARMGIHVDFVPMEYRGEGLLTALGDHDVTGKAFLIPRARIARDLVPRVLEERGARVEVVEAYQSVMPAYPSDELELLLSPPPDAITFTSSSTVLNFARLLRERSRLEVLRKAVMASIGPVTSEAIRSLGFRVTVEAGSSTAEGLVQALCRHYSGESV